MNINYNIEKNKDEKNMTINYYNKTKLCSVINININEKRINVVNYTNNNIEKAFGINENPTWQDFEFFLESRCFPRNRQNIKFELKQLGLNEYDPLNICKKTSGRNYKDEQWLEFQEDDLDEDPER